MESINLMIFDNEMEIVEESLRDIKSSYQISYDKIEELLEDAASTSDKRKKLSCYKQILPIIDDAIKEVNSLRADALDKGLSAGSKLVSVVLKIVAARNVMNTKAIKKNSDIVTQIEKTVLPMLTSHVLKSLDLKKKERLQRDVVSALIQIKKEVAAKLKELDKNAVANESYSIIECNGYDITMESLSDVGKSLIKGLNKLGYTIRTWVQRMISWINKKLYKLFNIDSVDIDVNYYNNIIGMINSLKNTGNDPKTYIGVVTPCINAILHGTNYEKVEPSVEKIKNTLSKVQQDLKSLKVEADKAKDIKPDPNAKKVTTSLKNLNALKSYFDSQVIIGKSLLQLVQSQSKFHATSNGVVMIGEASKKDTALRIAYSVSLAITNLAVMKSSICTQLVNGIYTNCNIKA